MIEIPSRRRKCHDSFEMRMSTSWIWLLSSTWNHGTVLVVEARISNASEGEGNQLGVFGFSLGFRRIPTTRREQRSSTCDNPTTGHHHSLALPYIHHHSSSPITVRHHSSSSVSSSHSSRGDFLFRGDTSRRLRDGGDFLNFDVMIDVMMMSVMMMVKMTK